MARFALTLPALLLVLTCSMAQAEDGFRLRSLNPFNDDPDTAPAPAEPAPQVIGVPDFREYTPPVEPSLLERLGENTRSTFGRMGEAVRAPFTPRPIERTASRDSWFQFPWGRPEVDDRPRTVGDWMEKERPQY